MPAKYIINANGQRVLSEDYHPSTCASDGHEDHLHTAPARASRRSAATNVTTPQEQQAILRKAAQEREAVRSRPGYNSLKK